MPGHALVRQCPAHRRQEPDGLEKVAPDHRQHDVELEIACGASEDDRGVVADDLSHNLANGLGDHRVDLPRHDRRARLEVGQVDLAEPAARSRGHPSKVVRDLVERDGDRPERSGRLDEGISGTLGLEMVTGLGEGQAGRRQRAAR